MGYFPKDQYETIWRLRADHNFASDGIKLIKMDLILAYKQQILNAKLTEWLINRMKQQFLKNKWHFQKSTLDSQLWSR
jgi:hypothetical protein